MISDESVNKIACEHILNMKDICRISFCRCGNAPTLHFMARGESATDFSIACSTDHCEHRHFLSHGGNFVEVVKRWNLEQSGKQGFCPTAKPPTESTVEHPSHYNKGKIEVREAIAEWGLNFTLGSAVKYIARADHKGDRIEDLRKAVNCIQFEIQRSLRG